MSWVAVAIGGSALVGAYASSKASKSAANAQAQAADTASQAELEMFYQGREDTAPWRSAGTKALNALLGGWSTDPVTGEKFRYGKTGLLEKGPGKFKESPDYQFTLGEGLKGIQRAASATGRLGSGAYLKDATKYAEGLASTEYQNFLNRYYQSLNPWLSMAGMGQISANQASNSATAVGNSLGENALYAGQAQAAGALGSVYPYTQAMNYGANQLGQYFTNQSMMNQANNQNALASYWNNANYTPSQMNTMSWL